MGFKVRNLTEGDYNVLVAYWKFWRFSPPTREFLPNNGLDGIMITDNGINVCAGFLYATSSPVLFHLEFIISNPEYKNKENRKKALVLLINSITNLSKNMGGKYIYTSLKNQNLIKHYEECGYKKGTIGATEMLKVL